MSEIVSLFLLKDEVTPEDAWRLVEWCHRAGADEFSLTFLVSGSEAEEACRGFDAALAPSQRDSARREGVVAYAGEEWVRPVPLWSLTPESLDQLRGAFADGPFADGVLDDSAWLEDLCLYRREELLLGVVTHEGYAVARVAEVEKQRLNEFGIRCHTQIPRFG